MKISKILPLCWFQTLSWFPYHLSWFLEVLALMILPQNQRDERLKFTPKLRVLRVFLLFQVLCKNERERWVLVKGFYPFHLKPCCWVLVSLKPKSSGWKVSGFGINANHSPNHHFTHVKWAPHFEFKIQKVSTNIYRGSDPFNPTKRIFIAK